MMERQDGRLPGEDYSENKQCELVFGQGSRICPHMVSDGKSKLFTALREIFGPCKESSLAEIRNFVALSTNRSSFFQSI